MTVENIHSIGRYTHSIGNKEFPFKLNLLFGHRQGHFSSNGMGVSAAGTV